MAIIRKSIMNFDANKQLFGFRSDSQIMVWSKPSEFLNKVIERPLDETIISDVKKQTGF